MEIYSSKLCLYMIGYEAVIEIWPSFGPVGSTEKKIGPILSNF